MKKMKTTNVHINSIVFAVLFCIGTMGLQADAQSNNYDQVIGEYVQFLQGQDQSSADYVLGLFKRYDLVILCERAHPETTQYDMILDIIRDKRFINQVGHVFTEVGSSSIGPRIESFLTDASLDEKEVGERARHICRNLTWYPYREMTSYYTLLRDVHQLNQPLAQDKKVHIYPSDLPLDWPGMTTAKYQAFRQSLRQRDKLMADQIAEKLNAIRNSSDPRKKALVIMNYRHAFPHLKISRGGRTKQFENVGGFLMERYPERVANVMINSIRLLQGSSDNRAVFTALQDGKWDAACAALGNPDVGFDFADSPFGADDFDYFPIPSPYKYQDVFSGFVFYRPLVEHRMSLGIPQAIDDAFVDELTKRYEVTGESAQDIAEKIEAHRKLRTFGYENEALFGQSDYEEKIRKWLQPAN